MMSKKSQVIIRYSEEQKASHQKKADKSGLSLSEYLRQSGDNAEIIIKDNYLNLRMISEVNRFGNNLNQMAKTANIANLSGNISDEMYQQFIHRLKLYSDEVKALANIVKLAGDI